MEAQQHRQVANKLSARAQPKMTKCSNSIELILLCGGEGQEDVGGECPGGSLTGRLLHQHLPAVDISLPSQIHVLLFMFYLLYEIEITSRYAFISLPAWWRGVTDSTLLKMSQTR